MKDRIMTLRKTLGITQRAFGDKIGISDVAISRIEAGKNALTEQNIKLICSTFKVNEEWLRSGKGEMFGRESLEKQAEELLNHFFALTPISCQIVLDNIRHLYLIEHGHTLKEAYTGIPKMEPLETIFEAIEKK